MGKLLKSGSRRARNIAILSAIVLLVGCDQVSKRVAKENLAGAETRSFVGDTFRLTYAENRGVFLGLGKTLPPAVRFGVFTLVVGVVLALILVDTLQRRTDVWWRLIAVTMVLAGGFGNLTDRVINNGIVVDFMNMGIGGLRTGIFNVADVLITTGAIMYLVFELTGAHPHEPTGIPPEGLPADG